MKLEGGEINDFRDRMGACSLMRNLSRPPDSALTADLDPFAPLDSGALPTPYPDIGLWTFPFFLHAGAILVDRTRSGSEGRDCA